VHDQLGAPSCARRACAFHAFARFVRRGAGGVSVSGRTPRPPSMTVTVVRPRNGTPPHAALARVPSSTTIANEPQGACF
jgi:hypothetical protein